MHLFNRHLRYWLPLMLALLASPAWSQHHEADSHGEASWHANYLAVFLGVTSEHRRDENATLGLEYERRLSDAFGIGAIVEHAYGDLDFTVYAIPFAYHKGAWKLYVAPGLEDPDHHSGTEFLFRVGAEYAFHFGDYEIAPQVDVDFVDGEEVLVYGITIGRGF